VYLNIEQDSSSLYRTGKDGEVEDGVLAAIGTSASCVEELPVV